MARAKLLTLAPLPTVRRAERAAAEAATAPPAELAFGDRHYVPVLKWKPAEQAAVLDLRRATQGRYTPLIEFVRPSPPSEPKKRKDGTLPLAKPHDPPQRALTHVENGLPALTRAHFLSYPFFLDPDLVGGTILPTGDDAWIHIIRRARDLSLRAVPVMRLSSSEKRRECAHAASTLGLALRVTRDDLWSRKAKLPRTVNEAAATPIRDTVSTRIERVRAAWSDKRIPAHLVLDLGSVAGAPIDTVETLMDKAYGAVLKPDAWKTLTIVGAGFPVSLVTIKKNDIGLVDRTEFLAWSGRRRERTYSRPPTFGDYVIQNSEAVEVGDPKKPINPYAAIRYTLRRAWLVVKGELISEIGGQQFITLAARLADDKRFFPRPPHCEGCRRILETKEEYEAVLDLAGWRRWGTVHHITLTVEQLEALRAF